LSETIINAGGKLPWNSGVPRVDTVSVIVPAHNEAERIEATITSIQAQTFKPNQVIVINDNSTDETEQIAKKLGATVVRTPSWSSGSKAKAQNAALPFVQSSYVAALDADTILEPNAIEEMVNAMKSNSNAVGACSWVTVRENQTLWQKGRTAEYTYSFSWFKRIQNYYKRPLICSGCFNIFKTSTLRWLGGYPTTTLAEDMDLTWTLYRKKIGRVLFVADALAYTDDPKTFKQLSAQLSRWSCAYYENIRKHYRGLWQSNKRAWAFVTVNFTDSLLGTFYYPILLVIGFFYPWLAIALLVSEFAIWAVVGVVGARRLRMTRAMLKFLPYLFVLRLVNCYFYMKYLVLTGMLGRSIGKYVKGH
jgi:cellulose synthase/poly-beta-1,6-N-acetylglucosamine synthase-like glycosyltransferase